MQATADSDSAVRFEGFSAGTELWGSTQANFLVSVPGHHAKEVAVLLNDPAAKALAEAAGREDTPELREEAARAVGEAVLAEALQERRPLDSVVTVSNWFLQSHPGVLERVRSALTA
jgi:hypothetical protein